ncbi:unnamed protein product [Symbiodinium natans]|uniref:Uncharacterized protein n=1 Tax=Symbiodinium natans TaxID=878477 RepID=A0A812P0Y0_9DINO|nr:unnamed protein product [Symbiodinium natans]
MGMYDDGILGGRKYVPPKMSDVIRGDWQEARGDRIFRIQEADGRLELEHQPPSGPALVLSRNDSTAAVLISWTAYEHGRSPGSGEEAFDLELEGENRVILRRARDGEAVRFVRLKDGQRLVTPSPSARRPRARQRARSSSVSDSQRGASCEEDHRHLVQKVKSLQSSARELNEKWQSYCEQYGRGIFDPNRHDVRTLQGYLDFISRDGERSRSRGGRAGRSRRKGRDGAQRHRRRGSPRVRRRGRRRKRRTGRQRDQAGGSAASTKHSTGSESSSSSSSGAQSHRATSKSPEAPAEDLQMRVARMAKESAEVDKAEAERALAEERAALETNLQYRVAIERDQRTQQAADAVASAEAEARAEEEARLKEAVRAAREAREAKVLAAKKDAEEAAEEAVQQFEKVVQEEVRSKLAPFESRLADALEAASRAAAAYDEAAAPASAKKRSRSSASDEQRAQAAKAAAAAFNSPKQAEGQCGASQKGPAGQRRKKKRQGAPADRPGGD